MRPIADPRLGAEACEELVAVVVRAEQLGFSRWRVATALGLDAAGLAAIERHAGLVASAPAQRMHADDPPR